MRYNLPPGEYLLTPEAVVHPPESLYKTYKTTHHVDTPHFERLRQSLVIKNIKPTI